MTADTISAIAQGGTAGLIIALVMALIGAIKGWWVPGYIHKADQSKLARFEELAYKAMTLAERAAEKG